VDERHLEKGYNTPPARKKNHFLVKSANIKVCNQLIITGDIEYMKNDEG